MKKIFLGLLLVTLLAGCSTKVNVDKDAIDKEQSVLRNQGYMAILGLFPENILRGIPAEQITETSAFLDVKDQKFTLSVTWDTDTSLKDAALMVGKNLGHELMFDEDAWKSSEGVSCASVSNANNSEGIEIRHTIPVSQVGGDISILTEKFPAAYFELPEELKIENTIERSVSSSWIYTLSWRYDIAEGQKVSQKLLKHYTKKENYSQETRGDKERLSFTTNGDDMSIEFWEEKNQVFIKARYQYNKPSHKDSSLMQALVDDPQACLLDGLPKKYWDILEEPQDFSLSYIPDENTVWYSMGVPDTGNLEAIIENAEKVFEGEFISSKDGCYNYESDEYKVQIKCNGDKIGIEIGKEAPVDFSHPYIHEIYPSHYDPQLPDALQKAPFIMETKYSMSNDYEMVALSKFWRFGEEEAKQAWQELQAAICEEEKYASEKNGEKYQMRCFLTEYIYECNLEKKGEHWMLTVEYRIGI